MVNYSSLPNFRYCQRAQVVKGGDRCYLFGIPFDSYVIKRFRGWIGAYSVRNGCCAAFDCE